MVIGDVDPPLADFASAGAPQHRRPRPDEDSQQSHAEDAAPPHQLVLFASTATSTATARGREKVDADVARAFKQQLSRAPKIVQGHVLFEPSPDVYEDADALARAVAQLQTVDYVHVLLVSTALNNKAANNSGDGADAMVEKATAGGGKDDYEEIGGGGDDADSEELPGFAAGGVARQQRGDNDKGLRAIRDAAAGVTSGGTFARAIALWRSFGRLEGRLDDAALATPTSELARVGIE